VPRYRIVVVELSVQDKVRNKTKLLKPQNRSNNARNKTRKAVRKAQSTLLKSFNKHPWTKMDNGRYRERKTRYLDKVKFVKD